MSQKLRQTIEWFLKDTPDNAELDLTNLRCNPTMVKLQLQLMGYHTPNYSQDLYKVPNEKYKYRILFEQKIDENFSLSVECDVSTFKIKLIKKVW